MPVNAQNLATTITPYRQVFAKALPLHVLGARQVDQVIPYLEVQRQLIQQRRVVPSVVAKRLHQGHR